MALPIEDYALVGDCQTAALVGKDGSIDWLCLPRFDSPACFAALLGDPGNGRWLVAPASRPSRVVRRYRGDSLVLETEFVTPEGVVRVIDCMPPRQEVPDVVRLVEGVSGRVPMRCELTLRFGYGRSVPWVRRMDGVVSAVAGPDAVVVDTPVPLRGEGLSTVAEFTVGPGERVPFVLEWHPSHEAWSGRRRDAAAEVADTESWWSAWASRSTYDGGWRDAVMRSLVTLKALTYAPTGGIVAAPTTSLPEQLGGVRNWDYRYCWLRDATLTLYALMSAGYEAEAAAWRDWLLRAVAGSPAEMQIMYGVGVQPAGALAVGADVLEVAAVGDEEHVHDLAVHVELELAAGGVADADRRRTLVAGEPRHLVLVEAPLAADAVHDLQRARLAVRRVPEAPLQPRHERAGLVGEPEIAQRPQCQRRIAKPAVAVVPVAHAADHFRQ